MRILTMDPKPNSDLLVFHWFSKVYYIMYYVLFCIDYNISMFYN